MQSSKNNGSLTHVRYGHTSRPRLIEVVCPSCGCLAQATKPSESAFKGEIVGDLSPSYHIDDWRIVCLSCPKRMDGLAYKELPKLFYSEGELGVWAWNTDHANCIIDYLSNKDTSNNPYHWFMTYVRGNWKQKPDKAISELKKMHNKALQRTSR